MDENRSQQEPMDEPDYGHEQAGRETEMGTGTSEQLRRPDDGGNPSVTDESGSWENKGDEESDEKSDEGQ